MLPILHAKIFSCQIVSRKREKMAKSSHFSNNPRYKSLKNNINHIILTVNVRIGTRLGYV